MPLPTVCDSQPISPSLPRKLAIITSAENHTTVSQAPLCLSTSSQLSTPVASSTARPISAAVVGLTASAGPKIIAGMPAHSTSNSANTPRVIFSGSVTGPSACSFSRAKRGASGVLFTSGGYSR